MFAVEMSSTWGPGPVPEPIGYWARTLDSVVNNPQAVATIIAAFFGFLFGTLIKYGLDRRADRLRRETDRRILAIALRGELLSLDTQAGSRVKEYEKLLNEKPETEVFGGPHSFARLALPPRQVWMAHLGRIGELEGVDPDVLTLAHFSFDSYDLAVEISKQQAGGQGVRREVLQINVGALKKMQELIMKAGVPLFEQTKVGPSWWRRILRFKGLRRRARPRAATEAIPKEHRETS